MTARIDDLEKIVAAKHEEGLAIEQRLTLEKNRILEELNALKETMSDVENKLWQANHELSQAKASKKDL